MLSFPEVQTVPPVPLNVYVWSPVRAATLSVPNSAPPSSVIRKLSVAVRTPVTFVLS